MNVPKLSIVVCGWYFKDHQFYELIKNEIADLNNVKAELYIASHRKKTEIPETIIKKLINEGWKIEWFENEGWEWGAYQQFLKWQENQCNFTDYYLFMHDDINIVQNGFINAFLEKINAGAVVVGNSPSVTPEKQTRNRYPEDLFFANSKGFTINCEKWKVVRGSCFFTTGAIASSVLGEMPIKKGKRIDIANSNLRIFGAKITEEYGLDAIQYLGETPRNSQFIYEEFRGDQKTNFRKKILNVLPRAVIKLMLDFKYSIKVEPVSPCFGLKVTLGCGSDPLPRYINVDLDTKYSDISANLLSVDFEKQTVAEVMMIHVIERINYSDLKPFLSKIYEWLKPGGQLIIEFPDLIKVCHWIKRNKRHPHMLTDSPFGMITLYGPQDKGEPWKHRWCWTFVTIKPFLRDIGFRQVFEEKPRFHVRKLDSRIIAVK